MRAYCGESVLCVGWAVLSRTSTCYNIVMHPHVTVLCAYGHLKLSFPHCVFSYPSPSHQTRCPSTPLGGSFPREHTLCTLGASSQARRQVPLPMSLREHLLFSNTVSSFLFLDMVHSVNICSCYVHIKVSTCGL